MSRDDTCIGRRGETTPRRRNGRSASRALLHLLLTSTAVHSPAHGAAEPDACTVLGATVDCSGDQSGGIDIADEFGGLAFTQINVGGAAGGLTAGFGGLIGNSGFTAIDRSDPRIDFDIDATSVASAGVGAWPVIGPIELQLRFVGSGVADPTLGLELAADDVANDAVRVAAIGIGPDNSSNADRRTGYGIEVGLAAATEDGTLTSEALLGVRTEGGSGVSNQNGYDAGAAGDIRVTARTGVVLDSSTGAGADIGAALSMTSIGGQIQSSATTTRGGAGGDLTLTTEPGAYLDITNTTRPSALMQSTGGGVLVGLPASGGGTGGDGGDITIDDAAITARQLSDQAGVALISTGSGSDTHSSVAGLPAGGGGAISMTGVFDVATEGESAEAVAGVSQGGVGGLPGNAGGQGGAVTADLKAGGSIRTVGAASGGPSGQSLGGRGGNAPDVQGLIAFAPPGGAGGDGRAVDLTNSGPIITAGDGSYGILGQSIGGGGGNGGMAVT